MRQAESASPRSSSPAILTQNHANSIRLEPITSTRFDDPSNLNPFWLMFTEDIHMHGQRRKSKSTAIPNLHPFQLIWFQSEKLGMDGYPIWLSESGQISNAICSTFAPAGFHIFHQIRQFSIAGMLLVSRHQLLSNISQPDISHDSSQWPFCFDALYNLH